MWQVFKSGTYCFLLGKMVCAWLSHRTQLSHPHRRRYKARTQFDSYATVTTHGGAPGKTRIENARDHDVIHRSVVSTDTPSEKYTMLFPPAVREHHNGVSNPAHAT